MSTELTETLRASCPPRAQRVRRTWAQRNPEVSAAIRALLAEGMTAGQVAAALEAQGIPAPYGGRWTGPAVRRAVESVR